jgi:hypothetical protein
MAATVANGAQIGGSRQSSAIAPTLAPPHEDEVTADADPDPSELATDDRQDRDCEPDGVDANPIGHDRDSAGDDRDRCPAETGE